MKEQFRTLSGRCREEGEWNPVAMEVVMANGSYHLPAGAVDAIYPQWFGAKLDGGRDDTAEVQAAVDTITTRGAAVLVLGSFAKVKSIDVTMPDDRQGITIRGTGLGSGFVAGACGTDILVVDTGPWSGILLYL